MKRPYLLWPTLRLRPYQIQGVSWLVSMFQRRLNGILADEMGLGKTVQTISLLAHLACRHGIWGPHLVVVPTSVLLNWDAERLTIAFGAGKRHWVGAAKAGQERTRDPRKVVPIPTEDDELEEPLRFESLEEADVRLRRLEQAAAQGDAEAALRLGMEMERIGRNHFHTGIPAALGIEEIRPRIATQTSNPNNS